METPDIHITVIFLSISYQYLIIFQITMSTTTKIQILRTRGTFTAPSRSQSSIVRLALDTSRTWQRSLSNLYHCLSLITLSLLSSKPDEKPITTEQVIYRTRAAPPGHHLQQGRREIWILELKWFGMTPIKPSFGENRFQAGLGRPTRPKLAYIFNWHGNLDSTTWMRWNDTNRA